MEKMNLFQKLSCIQNEMKVPKNLYNKFGNYYYRNAETILETAKPICQKHKCTLIVRDVIENVEGRFYVKAIACLCDWESDKFIEGVAYAREDESKKGMDGSQITGSTSSYARKYALNGLFNLDDVKDADSNEQKEESENKQPKKPTQIVSATEKQINMIKSLYTEEEIDSMLKRMKKSINELTLEEASKMIKARKQ